MSKPKTKVRKINTYPLLDLKELKEEMTIRTGNVGIVEKYVVSHRRKHTNCANNCKTFLEYGKMLKRHRKGIEVIKAHNLWNQTSKPIQTKAQIDSSTNSKPRVEPVRKESTKPISKIVIKGSSGDKTVSDTLSNRQEEIEMFDTIHDNIIELERIQKYTNS